jgi:hypothetical protein
MTFFELAIVYQSVPDIDHRQGNGESQIHYGALHLTDIRRNATNSQGPTGLIEGPTGR